MLFCREAPSPDLNQHEAEQIMIEFSFLGELQVLLTSCAIAHDKL